MKKFFSSFTIPSFLLHRVFSSLCSILNLSPYMYLETTILSLGVLIVLGWLFLSHSSRHCLEVFFKWKYSFIISYSNSGLRLVGCFCVCVVLWFFRLTDFYLTFLLLFLTQLRMMGYHIIHTHTHTHKYFIFYLVYCLILYCNVNSIKLGILLVWFIHRFLPVA